MANVGQQYFSQAMAGSGLCIYDAKIAQRLTPSLVNNGGLMTELMRDERFMDRAQNELAKYTFDVTFQGSPGVVRVYANALDNLKVRLYQVSGELVEGMEVIHQPKKEWGDD